MYLNRNILTRATNGCLVVGMLLVTSAFLTSCNKTASGMKVKTDAGERNMPVKSSYAYAVTKSFTDINRNITTAATYNVFAANYDLDAGNFAQTMNKPLTADDQIRVTFSLVGDQGTDEKAAAKAGDYAAKADKFMKVETVGIITRSGGADKTEWLDRSTLTGNAKITSVSGDTITGDIDVSAGGLSIKGPFTAKVLKRK
jgi:hypothetical protein